MPTAADQTDRRSRELDAEIASYGVIHERPARDLQALTELAAQVCGVPNAAINLITSGEQHQVGVAGIDAAVCGREDSMCAVVLADTSTVVVPDASLDPRFAENPFVSGVRDHVRFYASAPLVMPSGRAIGRLCVFDSVPGELTDHRAELLRSVAERVVDVLELRLRSRQLEQSLAELTRTRDDLRRSNELLSLFAGQVTHDLRSPLTAVLASTELLTEEPAVRSDPAALELARSSLVSGRRMAALIDNILEQTRVGARIELARVDLGAVLDEVETDLAPTLVARDAQVVRDALPAVCGDARQLYAVLLNLVSNAVKFTAPDTRPRVEVRARRQDDTWRVSVTDNGRGVSPEDRESLFELYSRGEHPVAGWGIGLATARRAVEAHGGRIGISDGSDGGTTVWFVLPVQPSPAPARVLGAHG